MMMDYVGWEKGSRKIKNRKKNEDVAISPRDSQIVRSKKKKEMVLTFSKVRG